MWEVKCYAEGLKLMAPLHSEIRAGFSEKGGTTGGWRSKDGKCQEACSKTKILCQAYLISQVSVTNMWTQTFLFPFTGVCITPNLGISHKFPQTPTVCHCSRQQVLWHLVGFAEWAGVKLILWGRTAGTAIAGFHRAVRFLLWSAWTIHTFCIPALFCFRAGTVAQVTL